MAIKRITMQELADACGLSRNTVSKVFNERGTVPDATKQLVLRKAEELGYLQLTLRKPAVQKKSRVMQLFKIPAAKSLLFLFIQVKMLPCLQNEFLMIIILVLFFCQPLQNV